MTFDTKITWKSHIAKKKERVSSRLNVLNHLAGSETTHNSHRGDSQTPRTATEAPKTLEKAYNQALRLITGRIKSTPIDAMLLVTGSTTICSLIKEKVLILYEKLLRIPMDKFFSIYENGPRHLKTQFGLIQKAIELEKELQIDDKPKSLSLPMNILTDTDATINVNYPADQWLQVFTDGSYIENQAKIGAGVYFELFSFYAAAGHNRSVFEGEIEATKNPQCQLCCLDTKFTKAVILSNSQSAINSINNREPPKTAEIKECRKLYGLLREKNKTVVLQWISGHCGIKSNELADTLAKKRATIFAMHGPADVFPHNEGLNQERIPDLKEKQWPVALSDIPDWPRIEAVAEFRLRTGHDCLAKHLHRLGVYTQPTCPLCNLHEEMEKTHLIRCPALK
ncbi:unnamed protein product, partial [Rodentolepis nana]|uniref:RNase H type-1 domain-containing protein n=1 Tax=Rodentolepis nana TaxID=102285 RepID=A0A0R3TEA1_RODNA